MGVRAPTAPAARSLFFISPVLRPSGPFGDRGPSGKAQRNHAAFDAKPEAPNAGFGSSPLRTSAGRERAGSPSIVTNIGVVAAPLVRRSVSPRANSSVRPIERLKLAHRGRRVRGYGGLSP
jgi:hypothetical protein